jgi:hypothetical protein
MELPHQLEQADFTLRRWGWLYSSIALYRVRLTYKGTRSIFLFMAVAQLLYKSINSGPE